MNPKLQWCLSSGIALTLLAVGAAVLSDDQSAEADRFVHERVVDAFPITAGYGSDKTKRAKLDAFLLENFDARQFARLGLCDAYAAFGKGMESTKPVFGSEWWS